MGKMIDIIINSGMALQNNIHFDHPLLPDLENDDVLLVDKLYAKAYSHFQVCIILSGIYSALKLCITPFILFLVQNNRSETQVWLILLIPLSILHVVYYWQAWKFVRRREIYLKVAGLVSHAAFFSPDQVSEVARQTNVHEHVANFRNPNALQVADKQVKILSLEIKYETLREDWKIMIAGRLLFCLYTGLHIWGYIIFITETEPNPADYYTIVVFFIGTYQYLQVYLGLVGFIIVLPFILIYLAVRGIKKYRKNKKLARMLIGQPFSPSKVKGGHSCHICMQDYKKNDILSTLPCNQMHHFHQACVEQWIKISGTCPLCRVGIDTV